MVALRLITIFSDLEKEKQSKPLKTIKRLGLFFFTLSIVATTIFYATGHLSKTVYVLYCLGQTILYWVFTRYIEELINGLIEKRKKKSIFRMK